MLAERLTNIKKKLIDYAVLVESMIDKSLDGYSKEKRNLLLRL